MEHNHNINWNLDTVKTHVRKHKRAYSIGTVVVIAGVAYYIGTRTGPPRVALNVLSNKGSIFGINNKLDQRVITLVDRPGPPSWIIGKVGTNEEWSSQGLTAAANQIRESDLRAHLNGLLDNVNGERYYRKGLAAA